MNKISKLVILSFLFSSALFSENLSELQDKRDKHSVEEETQLPPVYDLMPFPTRGVNIGLSADFLYWGMRLNNLDYAVSSSSALPAGEKGTTKSFDFSYNPGFRVGINTVFPQNLWVVNFEYTRIHQNDTKNEGYGFSPTFNVGNLFGNSLANITANSIEAQFKQTYNNLDITLGRYIQLSNWTLFKPYIGIEGAYIDYDYNVGYLSSFGAPLVTATDLFVHMTNYYWAAGLKVGFDSLWHFTKSFSLIGNLGISGLSSHFSLRRKDSTASPDDPANKTLVTDIQSTIDNGTFVLDFLLGLRYEIWSKQETWHFSLSAGWEQVIWFDISEQIFFNQPNSSNGGLDMQGLTVKAMINF